MVQKFARDVPQTSTPADHAAAVPPPAMSTKPTCPAPSTLQQTHHQGGSVFCLAVPTAELSTSSRPARDAASCGERQMVAGLTQREKDRYHVLTTAEVLRWLKLVPTHLELQIRRPRWWQSNLMVREDNEALLGIFFGRLGAEVEGPLLDNGKAGRELMTLTLGSSECGHCTMRSVLFGSGEGDRSFHQLFLHTRERHPTSILFDHEEVTDQPHGESTWFLRSCAASGDYKRMPLVSFNFLHTTGRSTSRVLVISARLLPRRRKPCTNRSQAATVASCVPAV